MHDIDPFSQYNIPKNGEEREHSREGGAPVDDEKRYMINFQAVSEIPNPRSTFVGVRDDDDFVAAVDELGGELVNVRFDATGLGEEEVADHGNAVGGRHDG